MRTLHTATPWSYNRDEGGCQGHFISTAELVVCYLDPPEELDDDAAANYLAAFNARFIARSAV